VSVLFILTNDVDAYTCSFCLTGNLNNYYNYYIHLTAFFQDNLETSRHQKGKPFWILLERDDGVAVASAAPCANHLHFAPDR